MMSKLFSESVLFPHTTAAECSQCEEQYGDEDVLRDGEHRHRQEREGAECAHHLQVCHSLPHQRGAERICTVQPLSDGLSQGHLIREATGWKGCLDWFHTSCVSLTLRARKRLPIPVSSNSHSWYRSEEQIVVLGKAAAYMCICLSATMRKRGLGTKKARRFRGAVNRSPAERTDRHVSLTAQR